MLFIAILTLPVLFPGAADDPPVTKELFAKEKWYQDLKGPEQELLGRIVSEYFPITGKAHVKIFILKTTIDGKERACEITARDNWRLLHDIPWEDKQVKLTGKLIPSGQDGQIQYKLAPARVIVLVDKDKQGKKQIAATSGYLSQDSRNRCSPRISRLAASGFQLKRQSDSHQVRAMRFPSSWLRAAALSQPRIS